MATTYSQLGILEAERGRAVHRMARKALAIRLRLGVPQVINDLRRLAATVPSLARTGSLGCSPRPPGPMTRRRSCRRSTGSRQPRTTVPDMAVAEHPGRGWRADGGPDCPGAARPRSQLMRLSRSEPCTAALSGAVAPAGRPGLLVRDGGARTDLREKAIAGREMMAPLSGFTSSNRVRWVRPRAPGGACGWHIVLRAPGWACWGQVSGGFWGVTFDAVSSSGRGCAGGRRGLADQALGNCRIRRTAVRLTVACALSPR
jgi:hypothetical protein